MTDLMMEPTTHDASCCAPTCCNDGAETGAETRTAAPAAADDVKTAVRDKYARVATAGESCCGSTGCGCGADDISMIGDAYDDVPGYLADADFELRYATRSRPDGGSDVLRGVHLFLLGVSHRTAPVDLRERLDFSSRDLGAAVEALAARPSAAESVVLSTCNRSEIYVASSSPEAARPLRAQGPRL